jgi:murein L,D-transpeptidase YafK
MVYSDSTLLHTFRVGLGTNPDSAKQRQGDRATPEGVYAVAYKNPDSRFYKSLALTYPNQQDAERGLRTGLITQKEHDAILAAHRQGRTPPWNTALGGEIFIHGHGSASDWTWGCIALDDSDMERLYRVVPPGTPITIRP